MKTLQFSLQLFLFCFFSFSTFSLSAQIWTNVTPSTGWPINPIKHSGLVIVDRTDNGMGYGLFNQGFANNPSSFVDNGVWGGLKYGLSRGKINLSIQSSVSGSSRPILLRSFYGLGFKTYRGKVSLGQNGIMTVGVDDSQIQSIAKASLSHPYKLYVKGGIRTEEVKVDLASNWPDYVFAEDYNLTSLNEIAHFIEDEGHLPGIPSAQELETEGLELGEICRLQQEKIEELFLHIIELNKKVELLKAVQN